MTEELLELLGAQEDSEKASPLEGRSSREAGDEGCGPGEEPPQTLPASGAAARLPSEAEGHVETPPAPDYRGHLASLAVQAESLRAELPGFSLREALEDPDFLRMTSPAVGLSVRRAWYALHGAELRRAAAEEAARGVTAGIASGALRPREGGRGLAAGALVESDPRRWSRARREDVRRRVLEAAARGEKVYPD